jgi:mRNA interferase HigB
MVGTDPELPDGNMIITGKFVIDEYAAKNRGQSGLQAAIRQFAAWYAEVERAVWKNPIDVKTMYRTASIIGSRRVVFNISGNKYRLVTEINYLAPVVEIRWFGTHSEYDRIDARTV